jgi:hypothetical protein
VKPLDKNAAGALFSPNNFSAALTILSAAPLRNKQVPMMAAMAIKIPILDAVFPNAVAILFPSGWLTKAEISASDIPFDWAY